MCTSKSVSMALRQPCYRTAKTAQTCQETDAVCKTDNLSSPQASLGHCVEQPKLCARQTIQATLACTQHAAVLCVSTSAIHHQQNGYCKHVQSLQHGNTPPSVTLCRMDTLFPTTAVSPMTKPVPWSSRTPLPILAAGWMSTARVWVQRYCSTQG